MADRGRCGNDLHPNKAIRMQNLANVRHNHESKMLSIAKGGAVVDHRLEEKYIKVYGGSNASMQPTRRGSRATLSSTRATAGRSTFASNQLADAIVDSANDNDDDDDKAAAGADGEADGEAPFLANAGDAAGDADKRATRKDRPRSAPVFRGRSAMERMRKQKAIDRENAFLMARMKRIITHSKPLWSNEFGTRHAIKVDHLEVLRPKDLLAPLFGVNTSNGRIRPHSSAGHRTAHRIPVPASPLPSAAPPSPSPGALHPRPAASSSPTSSSQVAADLEYSDDFLVDGDDGAPFSLTNNNNMQALPDALDGSMAFIKNLDGDDDGNHQLEASAVSFTLPEGQPVPSRLPGSTGMARPKSAFNPPSSSSSPGVSSFLNNFSSSSSRPGSRPSSAKPVSMSRRPSVSPSRPSSATDTEPPRRQSVVTSLSGLSRLRASERIIVENEKIVKHISKIMGSRPSSSKARPTSAPGGRSRPQSASPQQDAPFAYLSSTAAPSSRTSRPATASRSRGAPLPSSSAPAQSSSPLYDFSIPASNIFSAPSPSALARAMLHPESDHIAASVEADRFERENEEAIREWEASLAKKLAAVDTARISKKPKVEKYLTQMQREAKDRETKRQEEILQRLAQQKAEEEEAAAAVAKAARLEAETKSMAKTAEREVIRARGLTLAASKFNSVLVKNEEKRRLVQAELKSLAAVAALEVMRYMQRHRTESIEAKDVKDISDEIRTSRNMDIIRMTLVSEKQDEALNSQIEIMELRTPEGRQTKSIKAPKDFEQKAFAVLKLLSDNITGEAPQSRDKAPSILLKMASHIDLSGGTRGGKTSWQQDYLLENYDFDIRYDIEDEVVKLAGTKRNVSVELTIEVISPDTIEIVVDGNNQLVDGGGDLSIGKLSFTQKVPSLVVGEREAGVHYAQVLASRLVISKHATFAPTPTVESAKIFESPSKGGSPLKKREEARKRANSVLVAPVPTVRPTGWYLKTENTKYSII